MKKVKTLLAALFAVTSMSACSVQEIMDQVGGSFTSAFDSVKDLIGIDDKESEKEEKGEDACHHEDKNHDGTCDLCGEAGLEVVHSDDDRDHVCDVCGEKFSDHVDENSDFVCDYCGHELEVVSVELDTTDATLAYALGQEFSLEGVKVIATSEVGSKKELVYEASQPDMSEVGVKEVTISSGDHEFKYSIEVSYWSEADLAIFEEASFIGNMGKSLPYLPGFNMHVEAEFDDNEELQAWHVEADNITVDGYMEFYSMLQDFSAVVTQEVDEEETEVYYSLVEVSLEDVSEYHGLTDLAVFYIAPFFLNEKGNGNRVYIYDEYLILGVKEDKLVLESKFVNAMLDGFFFGESPADGYYGFPAAYNAYVSYLPNVIGMYYSELSYYAFVTPTLSKGASFVPMSLFALYPLVDALDAYDLAWVVEFDNAVESDYTNFVADLLAAGYTEYPSEVEGGDPSYILYNDLVGYMEFIPYFGTTSSGAGYFIFEFYYIAPDSYTNELTAYAAGIGDYLGFSYEIDNDGYPYYVDAYYVTPALEEGTTSFDVCAAIAKALNGFEGFFVLEGVEEWDEYQVTLCDGYACVTFYVENEPQEDGSFKVTASYYYGEYSLSDTELEFKSIFGEDLIKGVDYTEVTYGSSYSINFEEEVDPTEFDIQTYFAQLSSSLPESYELIESSQEDNVYTFVFGDIERSYKLTAKVTLDGAKLSLEVTLEAYRFIFPETVVVDFLTAYRGEEPSKDDYKVNEDMSAEAAFAIEDSEASADKLKDVAEELAKYYGESFAITDSSEGEGAWVVTLSSENLGIDASVTVSVSESGYSVGLYSCYTPEPAQMSQSEIYLREVLAAFGTTSPVLGEDYYQYDTEEYFYTSFAVAYATGEENLEELAEYYIGALSEDFSVLYSSEATTHSLYQVDSWTITLLTSDYSYVAVLEVFVVQGYVVLAFDVFANA